MQILSVLGDLLQPGVTICTWVRPAPKEENGKLVHYLGWPEYDHRVDELFETSFGASDPANPYVTLPEDPPNTVPQLVLQSPTEISGATANQIQRWLLLTKRQERFSDGHIERQFQNGMMLAAYQRLAQIIRIDGPGS